MKTEMTHEQWAMALTRCQSSAERAALNGPSPGGAAARLDLSRSTIYAAINKGYLDAIVLLDSDGQANGLVVTDASLDEYITRRERRANAKASRSA